ncbi:hypothetical protein C8R47DRAFT_1215715 [Mycena vitilis]|nr:hypothetical protein C8R47DRAFT_1215715 [Mycena vitilis]
MSTVTPDALPAGNLSSVPASSSAPHGLKRGSERGSTPGASKPTAERDFHGQLLTEARRILADTNPQVIEVSFNDFCSTRLPQINTTVFDKVIAALTDSHHGILKGGKMYGYAATTPGALKVHETVAFAGLCRFISKVVKCGLEQDPVEPWVAHCYKQADVETERENTSRPDSYIHLLPILGKIGWHQLLVTAEFKKNKKDWLQNWVRLLWGCNHVLRNDPRRRFTFGLTAEDDEARIWFFSRACIVATQPIKYIEDPKPLVRFILSIVLQPAPRLGIEPPKPDAPPALDHLGFDPSIRRLYHDNQITYEVEMGNDIFVLQRVLCDYKVDELIGRATRVWQVVKRDLPTEQYVIKDVWLEDGARSEGEIMSEIEQALQIHPHSEELMPLFTQHFLPPAVELAIGTLIQGVGAHPEHRYLCFSANTSAPQSSTASGSVRSHPTGNTMIVTQPHPPPRRYVNRRQCRMLFQGTLVPLHLLRDAGDQARVLADMPPLQVLLAVDRVHRDLSPTNIMLDRKTGRGILTDLEYTVRYGQASQGDIKTGTPYFWSVEVEQNGTYLFTTVDAEDEDNSLNLDELVPLSETISRNPEDEEITAGNPFFHNILHDLESVWWMMLWATLFFIPTDELGESRKVQSDRVDLYLQAFPTKEWAGTRTTFLRMDGTRKIALQACKSMPHSLRTLMQIVVLSRIPKAICAGHRLAQTALTEPGKTIPKDHHAFLKAIKDVQGHLDTFLEGVQKIMPTGKADVESISKLEQDVLVLTYGPDEKDRPGSQEGSAWQSG